MPELLLLVAFTLLAFCMGLASLFLAIKALRSSDKMEAWRREAESSGNKAGEQLDRHEKEIASIAGILRAVSELQRRIHDLEGRTGTTGTDTVPRAPARSEVPAFSSIPVVKPAPPSNPIFSQSPSPPPPARDAYANDLDILRRDFNAAALEPSLANLDKFAAKHQLEDAQGDLWHMRLRDGRVAVLPGKPMVVGWARQYRGETGKSLRDDHLARWYDMCADDVLALDRVAIQQVGGATEKGALRGI